MTFTYILPRMSTYLFLLLLLAQLLVLSLSRPAHSCRLCGPLKRMSRQMTKLQMLSRTMLVESEVEEVGYVEYSLESLPAAETTAGPNHTQINETLSGLQSDLQSFLLHVDWLRELRQNGSLPSLSVTLEVTDALRKISSVCSAMLEKMGCPSAQSAVPSFPSSPTAYNTLLLSIEISERLFFYSSRSSRMLLQLTAVASRL